MPELVLCGSPPPATPPSAHLDSIDAALNTYAAPTLRSLKIDVSGVDRCDVPAYRISLWLRFASQRIAGKLRLRIDLKEDARRYRDMKEELALPICDRATEIHLRFLPEVFLRPPPTGSFSALTDLMISCGQMDGGELERAVSSPQCPRLRKLYIYVPNLVPVCDVSICSESLECLDYNAMKTGKLEVNAPMLQEISVSHAAEACIIAPKLEMVRWSGEYNPGLHQFAVSGRHLQSLYIMHSSFLGMLISSTQLMKRYDSAKELIVSHGLYQKTSCSVSGCPCLLPENYRLDGITFDSLEEIGIKFFTGSGELEQFMKLLLSKCNTATLKRVDITVPLAPVSSEIMEAVERIRSVCHPNSKTQFNVHAREAVKPLAP